MRALRFAGVTGLLALALAPAQAQGAELRAGVGKADITPRTGYYLGGWTRADRVAQGQHTRLFSRALVLERGGRKIALVSLDLFMVPGGMVQAHRRGAGRARVLRAQHPDLGVAHALGPGRLRELPDLQHRRAQPADGAATRHRSSGCSTRTRPTASSTRFLVQQISTAIIRADRDLGPAVAGWGAGAAAWG